MPILEKIGVLHTIIIRVLRGEGLLRTISLAIHKPEFFKFVSGLEGNEVLCDISVSSPEPTSVQLRTTRRPSNPVAV